MITSALIESAVHHCWQQERWAHADFFWNMNPASRAKLGAEGTRPWRGAMSPSVLSLINILEEMGVYDDTGLGVPANAA